MCSARYTMNRRRFAAVATAAAIGPFAAAARGTGVLRDVVPVTRYSGRAFGTEWRVTLGSGPGDERLREAIIALLDGIDRAMSPWRSNSAVTRFNTALAGVLAVPDDTRAVTEAALAIAAESGGWFDPTVGPLVARWGFGPIRGDERPGWREVTVTGDGIGKSRSGLTLDLCGIAKGWALDRIAALLADAGETDFLVDLGGELAARGLHPSGRSWQVAIEDPRLDANGVAAVLRLHDVAVATSGTRAQSYTLGGRTYGHIVDPFDRSPAAGTLASVTVIAANAMTADGWATALAAAGAEAGPSLARSRDLSALFLTSGSAELARIATGLFTDYLV